MIMIDEISANVVDSTQKNAENLKYFLGDDNSRFLNQE